MKNNKVVEVDDLDIPEDLQVLDSAETQYTDLHKILANLCIASVVLAVLLSVKIIDLGTGGTLAGFILSQSAVVIAALVLPGLNTMLAGPAKHVARSIGQQNDITPISIATDGTAFRATYDDGSIAHIIPSCGSEYSDPLKRVYTSTASYSLYRENFDMAELTSWDAAFESVQSIGETASVSD